MRNIFCYLAFLMCLLPAYSNADVAPVHSSISNAYDATCAVIYKGDSGFQIAGTGVLIKNGYIITAAHVVDINDNEKFEDNEKEIDVYFFSSELLVACDVVYFGRPSDGSESLLDFLDVAILKPRVKLTSNIKLAGSDPLIGTPVFTIGMTIGEPPSITDGRINFPTGSLGRSSIPIFKGNSGGGVFDAVTQEYLGMLVQGTAQQITISILDEKISFTQPLFNISQYIKLINIKEAVVFIEQKDLRDRKIDYLNKIRKRLKSKKTYY